MLTFSGRRSVRLSWGVLVPIFLASSAWSSPRACAAWRAPCRWRDFSFLLEGLADGWVGELLIEVAIPFGFHLCFFSFAGRPAAGLEGLLAATLASCRFILVRPILLSASSTAAEALVKPCRRTAVRASSKKLRTR